MNRRKKSLASLLHFCVPPLNIAQTLRANGHSHNKWLTVSACWQHNSHLGTFTFRQWRLSRVGRQFEHALHMKVRTFCGTLRAHILSRQGDGSGPLSIQPKTGFSDVMPPDTCCLSSILVEPHHWLLLLATSTLHDNYSLSRSAQAINWFWYNRELNLKFLFWKQNAL